MLLDPRLTENSCQAIELRVEGSLPSSHHSILLNANCTFLQRYKLPIFVTENGFAVKGEDSLPISEAVHDHDRVEYFRGATDSLYKAMYEDGVEIRSYFPWSFLDNFEWCVSFSMDAMARVDRPDKLQG
jgi:beta-glucosidase/6-phospho-beta-glucosidase/beta-galactosidase